MLVKGAGPRSSATTLSIPWGRYTFFPAVRCYDVEYQYACIFHFNDVIISAMAGEFPAWRASYAENVSIWWRQSVSNQFGTMLSNKQFLQSGHDNHDDVIKWKHLPRNCAVPVNSPHKGQWRNFDVFFDLRMNKRLSKQPWGWWFGTP